MFRVGWQEAACGLWALPGLGIGLVLLILGNVGGCSHGKGLVENQYVLNPGHISFHFIMINRSFQPHFAAMGRTAIMKYHRMGKLNNRICFFMVLGSKYLRSKCQQS